MKKLKQIVECVLALLAFLRRRSKRKDSGNEED